MKRFLIALLPILLLCGCGKSNVPPIDSFTWEMVSVQSAADNGASIVYGESGLGTADDAVLLDMICTAENGVLTIMDNTNQLSYSGTYSIKDRDPESTLYDVVIEGNNGFAVTGTTSYLDESTTPTLIINLNEYVINFFPVQTIE